MTWRDRRKRSIEAAIRTFGTAVTFPDGSEFRGIFRETDDKATGAWGSEVGRAMRLTQQLVPYLDLLESDATGLAEKDVVQVEGKRFLIARLDPTGYGLTRASLMPEPKNGQGQRWR